MLQNGLPDASLLKPMPKRRISLVSLFTGIVIGSVGARFRQAVRVVGAGARHDRQADTAQEINDMDIPGFKLHTLNGKMKGRWPISVSDNWRVTFEFRDGNAFVLDYEDHH